MKHHGKLMAAALRDPTIVPHRILVIDGDCDIRRLCTDVLDGFGYRVDVASNGETGWEALRANQYNLLLTEEALPGVSGLELVGKMRAAHVALPVIMASERLSEIVCVSKLPVHQQRWNRSLKVAAIVSKPFTVDELLTTVRTVLQKPALTPHQTLEHSRVTRLALESNSMGNRQNSGEYFADLLLKSLYAPLKPSADGAHLRRLKQLHGAE